MKKRLFMPTVFTNHNICYVFVDLPEEQMCLVEEQDLVVASLKGFFGSQGICVVGAATQEGADKVARAICRHNKFCRVRSVPRLRSFSRVYKLNVLTREFELCNDEGEAIDEIFPRDDLPEAIKNATRSQDGKQ